MRTIKRLSLSHAQRCSNEEVGALHAEISKLIARNDELTAAVFSVQQAYQELKKEKEEEEARCVSLEEHIKEKEYQWKHTERQLNAEVGSWGGGGGGGGEGRGEGRGGGGLMREGWKGMGRGSTVSCMVEVTAIAM